MLEKIGIILLDRDEVVIRIYVHDNQVYWSLLRYQNYDLATFDTNKHVSAKEILEIIADVSLSQYAAHVTEWKICARDVTDAVIEEVANTISMHVELLTLAREQELLCKGILMEI